MSEPTDLTRLFDPRALAVVGASSQPGRVGRLVFDALRRSGRPVYPVHPRESEIDGVAVIREIAALPDEVDVAVIAAGAEAATAAAEACARRGVPFLIVLAGGFAETGAAGAAREARLAALAHRSHHPGSDQPGSRVLGPNTLGLQVPHAQLDTLFVEHADQAPADRGGVAFITQSGSVGVEALGLVSNIGFPLRAFVGLGNKCDLDEVDFLRHFAADSETRCVALYVESLDRGRAFLEAAREAARLKPVVVLKAGHTEAGAAAVTSHTGRLAGSDRVVDGAFRQFGVQRVADDEELCDAARALAELPPPRGNRVAIVSPAGGYGVIGADLVETRGGRARLTMARLAAETRARIRAVVPEFAAAGNPVDLTAVADDAMFAAALDALVADDGVDIVLVAAFFAPPNVSDALLEIVAGRATASPKPIIPFTLYGPRTDDYLRRLHQRGACGFPSVGRAVRAARLLVERAAVLAALADEGGEPPSAGRDLGARVESWLAGLATPGRPDEFEAKRLLAACGIAVPAGVRLLPDEPLPELDSSTRVVKLVVKLCSSNVAHKTEARGVALGVAPAALAATIADFRVRFPGQPLLIEEEVCGVGAEFIVGGLVDATFGRAVMVGSGGILTELTEDVAFRLAPCTKIEARRMLEELRVAPIFHGYRGLDLDADGLAEVIHRVGEIVDALGERFAALDLNPLVFAAGQWVALDARIEPGATS